uniref:Uncharacterized protein n=1 Tax=Glossina pallidipes TaxID=7398 RepID=A0A1B0A1X9_GLOPL
MSKQCPRDESEIFDKFRKTGCFKYLTSPILAASRCGDYYGPNTNYYETSQDFISPWRYEYINRKSKYHKCVACDEVNRNLWIAAGKSSIVIPDIAAKWYADQQKLQKLLTDIRKLTPEEALLYRQYLCQNQSLFSAPPLECLGIKPPIRNWINVDEEGSTNYMSPEFFELLRKHNESMNQLYNLNAHLPKYRSRELKRSIEPLRPTSSLGVTPQKSYYDEESRNVAKRSKKTVSEPVLGKKKKTVKSMRKPHLREIWKKTDGLVMRDSEASIRRHRKELDTSTATRKEVSRPVKPTYLKKKVRRGEAEQDYPKIKRVRLPIKRRHSERREQPFFHRGKTAPHYLRSEKSKRPPLDPYKVIWKKPSILSPRSSSAASKQEESESLPRKSDTYSVKMSITDDIEHKEKIKKPLHTDRDGGAISGMEAPIARGYKIEPKKDLISEFQSREDKKDLTYSDEDKKDLKKDSDDLKKDSDDHKRDIGEVQRGGEKEFQTAEDKKEDEDKKDLIKELEPRDDKTDLTELESREDKQGLARELYSAEERKILKKVSDDLKKELTKEEHVVDEALEGGEKKLISEPRTDEDKQDSTRKLQPDGKGLDSALLEFDTFLKEGKEHLIQGMHFDKHDKKWRKKDLKRKMSAEEWKRDSRKDQYKEDPKKNSLTDDREEALSKQPQKEGLIRYHTTPKRISTEKRDDLELPVLDEFVKMLLRAKEQNIDFEIQPRISHLAEKIRTGKRKTYLKKELLTDKRKDDLRKELPSSGRTSIAKQSVIEPATLEQKLEEALRTDKRKKDLPIVGRTSTLEESGFELAEQSVKKNGKQKKKLKKRRYTVEESKLLLEKRNGTEDDQDLESDMLKASFIRNEASMYLKRELSSVKHKERLRKGSPPDEYKEPFIKECDDDKEEFKEELCADDHKEKLEKEPPVDDHKDELEKEPPVDDHKDELEIELPVDDYKQELKEELPADDLNEKLKEELPADDLNEKLKEESPPDEYEQELKKESPSDEYEQELKKELFAEEYKEDLKKRAPTDKHEDDLKKELPITSLKRKKSSYHLIAHKHKIDFKKSCAQTTRRHQKDVGDQCLISPSEVRDPRLAEKISPYTSLHECQRAFYMINDFDQQIEKFGIKSSRRPKRFLRPADACPWPMIYPKIKAVQRDPCYRQSDNSFIRYQKAAQRVKLDLEETRRNGFLTWTSLKHMDFDCKNYGNVPMFNACPQTTIS